MLIIEKKDCIEKWVLKNNPDIVPKSCKVFYYSELKRFHVTYFIKGIKNRENLKLTDSEVDNIIKEMKSK